MVVAAVAAAVVPGVVGGVGIAAAAGGGVVVVVLVVVVEAAAAVEVVIESDFHIGICGVTGFGYGSGMERVWIGVWIGTRYLGRLSRYGCEGRERGISSLV